MFSAICRRIRVSPATVVAGLALVFAMTGGAYAAKKYLITSTKQISPSVLKQLQGKAGAAGAPGVAGAQGAQGPVGPQGPAGANGAQGDRGPQGERGATGVQGLQGKEGKQGATGATGTSGFTETLPSGKTETGAWSMALVGAFGFPAVDAAISFSIPLRGADEGPAFVFDKEQTEKSEFGSSGCKGTVTEPTAPAGKLCVYTATEELHGGAEGHLEAAMRPVMFEGYGPSGTFLTGIGSTEPSGNAAVGGTWAVTAP